MTKSCTGRCVEGVGGSDWTKAGFEWQHGGYFGRQDGDALVFLEEPYLVTRATTVTSFPFMGSFDNHAVFWDFSKDISLSSSRCSQCRSTGTLGCVFILTSYSTFHPIPYSSKVLEEHLQNYKSSQTASIIKIIWSGLPEEKRLRIFSEMNSWGHLTEFSFYIFYSNILLNHGCR